MTRRLLGWFRTSLAGTRTHDPTDRGDWADLARLLTAAPHAYLELGCTLCRGQRRLDDRST